MESPRHPASNHMHKLHTFVYHMVQQTTGIIILPYFYVSTVVN